MAASQAGASLAEALRGRVRELDEVLAGVTEEEASRPFDGDWTIRHVMSHLLGPEDGRGLVGRLTRVIDEDTPSLEVNVDDPAFTPARQQMSYADLLAAVHNQYAGMEAFLAERTDEQFARRAKLPASFANSPLTDTPTLAQWCMGLVQFHLAGHIAQIREHRV